MAEEPKQSEEKKKQNWIPNDFLKEVKSFANTEGKQMVGFVRDKFREAMEEEETEEQPQAEPKKKSVAVLPPELLDTLKTASQATGPSDTPEKTCKTLISIPQLLVQTALK